MGHSPNSNLICKYNSQKSEGEYEIPRYTEEFKEQIACGMMRPTAMSAAELNREIGISNPTLYNWRNKYRKEDKAVPATAPNPVR